MDNFTLYAKMLQTDRQTANKFPFVSTNLEKLNFKSKNDYSVMILFTFQNAQKDNNFQQNILLTK